MTTEERDAIQADIDELGHEWDCDIFTPGRACDCPVTSIR